MPSLCFPTHFLASLFHCGAEQRSAPALPRSAFPCLLPTPLCVSVRFRAYAGPDLAVLFCALAPLFVALLCPCVALPDPAVPCRCYSMLFFAIVTHLSATLCLCHMLPIYALPLPWSALMRIASATPCATVLCSAVAAHILALFRLRFAVDRLPVLCHRMANQRSALPMQSSALHRRC